MTESEKKEEAAPMTMPRALVKIVDITATTIIVLSALYMIFWRCPSCPRCEAKPCLPVPLPPPKTPEEYMRALYERQPDQSGFGVMVAALVIVSFNLTILLVRGVWSVVKFIGRESERDRFISRVRYRPAER